ncbi:hypothetical protein MMC34_002982 [Xylographa carneopallida]|nr:hypothetical protein [Xylographa carneopallida]
MKTPGALNLRYLKSKIHPPLSLNQRDSQKLLTLLTTSFRAHLDQEHGKIGSSNTSASEIHLQSVLDNPLFRVPLHSELQSSHADMQKSVYIPTRTSEIVEKRHENTVQHFEEHVRSGTASVHLAKLCLEHHLKRFRVNNVSGDEFKISWKVSVIMIQWLWSSGRERSLDFLEDKKFLLLLVPFLLVDGRDRHVQNWLLRLRSGLTGTSLGTHDGAPTHDNLRKQANIVYSLAVSEFKYGAGLQGAMRGFLDNVDSASEWVSISPHQQTRLSFSSARIVLRRAGNYLLRGFAASCATPEVDLVTFERFLQSTETWSANSSLDRAQLALLHPVAPDPSISLQYIRKEMQDAAPNYTPRQLTQVINLCLKTSKFLLFQGQHTDAQWVLDFVRETFPEEIGNQKQILAAATSGQQHKSTTARTESGVRELEALAFA